jgi:predicted RNA binding protein YcfA (HicA-like mRNA interferase family)
VSYWPSLKAKKVYKALLRIRWNPKPEKGSSHLQLQRSGFADYTWAFQDSDEIGPKMMARIAKHTGLTPARSVTHIARSSLPSRIRSEEYRCLKRNFCDPNANLGVRFAGSYILCRIAYKELRPTGMPVWHLPPQWIINYFVNLREPIYGQNSNRGRS